MRVVSVELCNSQLSLYFLPFPCYGNPRTYKGVVVMIGARIAALRRHAGMNQAELAQKLQVSPSAVGMYEQGRREPSAQTLLAIARIFRVSVDYLISGEVTDLEQQSLEQVLLSRITSADRRLEGRVDRPFSREELAVLFAAMLIEG